MVAVRTSKARRSIFSKLITNKECYKIVIVNEGSTSKIIFRIKLKENVNKNKLLTKCTRYYCVPVAPTAPLNPGKPALPGRPGDPCGPGAPTAPVLPGEPG